MLTLISESAQSSPGVLPCSEKLEIARVHLSNYVFSKSLHVDAENAVIVNVIIM